MKKISAYVTIIVGIITIIVIIRTCWLFLNMHTKLCESNIEGVCDNSQVFMVAFIFLAGIGVCAGFIYFSLRDLRKKELPSK